MSLHVGLIIERDRFCVLSRNDTAVHGYYGCPGLLSMLSEGGLLHSLDIRDCSQLSELCLMGLERAAFTSTRLRTLNVRGMAFADAGLGWVAQVGGKDACGAVRGLTEKGKPRYNRRDTSPHQLLLFSGQRGRLLSEPDYDYITHYTRLCIKFCSQGCKLLENLDISQCSLLTDRGLEYLANGCGANRPVPLKVRQ